MLTYRSLENVKLIDDNSVKNLGACTNLRDLNLSRTAVEDEGVRFVVNNLVNLVSLDLERTAISNEAVRYISVAPLPNLKRLNLLKCEKTRSVESFIRLFNYSW